MSPLSYKGAPWGAAEPLRAMASGNEEGKGLQGGTRTWSWKRTEDLERRSHEAEEGGGTSLVVQQLGICASTAWSMDWGNKIPMRCGLKKTVCAVEKEEGPLSLP